VVDDKSEVDLMDYKEDLAELVGITLGDGSLYFNRKHYVRQFVISGHSRHDIKYFEDFVLPLLKRNFGENFELIFEKKAKGIRIRSQSKTVFNKITKLGTPIGNKLENNVKIPTWVFSDKKLLRACIRGLIDTDGFVAPITGRNYSYIWLSSNIPALQKSVSKAMKILGFKTSNWSHESNSASQIYIGAKHMIGKYFNEIGFNNPYHKNRFLPP